jgi:hypothetical protein
MDINIHSIKKVSAVAHSLPREGQDQRVHFQVLTFLDKYEQECRINLFFDKASLALPFGDLSELDQADSSEDYMGSIEGESVAF